MSTETNSGTDALESYSLDSQASNDTPKKPKERLKNAVVARAIHSNLVDADEPAERNRAKIQDLKDYKPPLNQGMLKARSQSGRFNINFGETASQINEAMAPYVDDFVSPEHLVPVKLKYNSYSAQDQRAYERIMSDEYTRMVRDWTDGLFTYLTMVDQFVTQGIGVGYFKDKYDWRWSAAGLREFKFPRRTNACSGAIELATCEYQISPAELGGYIENEEVATKLGWNVKSVKRVLASASSDLYDDDSYEDQQEQSKANDYDDTSNPFRVVNLIYIWVKEFDGSVSYYITTKSESDAQESEKKEDPNFLFRQPKAYDSMSEAIHIFPYYTGNKGNLYSIRGLGYMAYSSGMASNLMQCAMLDAAKESMSVKYNAPSERNINSLPIINAGPVSLVAPGMSPIADQKTPDLQRSAMPALELLQRQMDRKSSSSSLSATFNNAPDRRSSSEAMAAVEHFSSINSAAALLWSRPWRDLISESVGRAFNPAQNDQIESGKAAKEMQKECILRGVPEEAFKLIDKRLTKTSIPVGPGSKAARIMQNKQMASLYTSMDAPGRAAFDREQSITIVGVEKTAEYFPPIEEERETTDHAIARLENNDLINGLDIQVSPSENYIVHLNTHVPKLVEYVQMVESGQLELTDAVQDMLPLYEHASETFEVAVVPELVVPELKQHKQTLQQIGEYINNGLRALSKMQREGEAAPQEGEDGEANKQNAEIQAAYDKHNMQMQMDAQKAMQKLEQNEQAFQQKQAHDRSKAMQDMAINDAKASSEIN